MLDYESETWEQLTDSAEVIGLDENCLPELYLRSVSWVSDVLAEMPVHARTAKLPLPFGQEFRRDMKC